MGKDTLFRKKKEMQRLVTDYEEDSRRLEQVKQQNAKVAGQKEHLENAKSQVEQELDSLDMQMQELTERCNRIVDKQRGKAAEVLGCDPDSFADGGTLEEKSVRADVLKDVAQNVLYTLSQLALEFPEVADELASRAQEASLRIPTKPPAKSLYQPGSAPASRQGGARPGTSGASGQREMAPMQTFEVEGL